MSETILIVDDDVEIAKLIYKLIQSNQFDADIAYSGEEALAMINLKEYSLMLLDVNMNGMDGFQVIEHLRRVGRKIPVIIVSGRKEDNDTLYGLDIGADDYVTKPFNPVILVAKVKALIRRSKGTLLEEDGLITAGPFSYNTSTLRLFKNNREIILTGKENAIMKLFLDNAGKIFSKDMLYDMVWGNTIVDDNAVMVYINHLRQKIEDDPDAPKFIQTIRGVGYRFVI